MANQNLPIISIIVPCFNHGMYLTECLESVLKQTYITWECIVIDNGSTDNTKEISERFILKDIRFKYIHNLEKGVSLARNTGIKNSIGKYILPLDADDKIKESYLEKAITVLEKDENIKVVYCEAEFFGNLNGKWSLPSFSMRQMLIDNVLFCSAMYRKQDYEKTKGYNTNMVSGFEDWDFWLSLIKKDAEVYRIPEVLFLYRIRKDSRNNSLTYEKQKVLRQQIYENHKELYHSEFNMSEVIFEYNLKKNELESCLHSNDYLFGQTILKPYRFIKKLFNR